MAMLAILKLISFKSVVTDYHIEVKLLVSNGFLEQHTKTKCTAAQALKSLLFVPYLSSAQHFEPPLFLFYMYYIVLHLHHTQTV